MSNANSHSARRRSGSFVPRPSQPPPPPPAGQLSGDTGLNILRRSGSWGGETPLDTIDHSNKRRNSKPKIGESSKDGHLVSVATPRRKGSSLSCSDRDSLSSTGSSSNSTFFLSADHKTAIDATAKEPGHTDTSRTSRFYVNVDVRGKNATAESGIESQPNDTDSKSIAGSTFFVTLATESRSSRESLVEKNGDAKVIEVESVATSALLQVDQSAGRFVANSGRGVLSKSQSEDSGKGQLLGIKSPKGSSAENFVSSPRSPSPKIGSSPDLRQPFHKGQSVHTGVTTVTGLRTTKKVWSSAEVSGSETFSEDSFDTSTPELPEKTRRSGASLASHCLTTSDTVTSVNRKILAEDEASSSSGGELVNKLLV